MLYQIATSMICYKFFFNIFWIYVEAFLYIVDPEICVGGLNYIIYFFIFFYKFKNFFC